MSTVSLTQFQAGSSPGAANQALKSAVKTMDRARHCAVVWFADIVQRKLFRELGYSSIYQYAQIELGFSSTRTGDFLRLAKKLEELPQLKQELEAGKIGYTAARELIKVAGPGNEKEWLDEAHKCPDCEKATTATSRGEIPLTNSEQQRLECDAQIAETGHPNRSTIPPAVKRTVLSRDRHRCQSPGCTSARFLEVHHIIPRNQGGSNKPENLVSLCGGCHQLLHDCGTKFCPRGAKPKPQKLRE